MKDKAKESLINSRITHVKKVNQNNIAIAAIVGTSAIGFLLLDAFNILGELSSVLCGASILLGSLRLKKIVLFQSKLNQFYQEKIELFDFNNTEEKQFTIQNAKIISLKHEKRANVITTCIFGLSAIANALIAFNSEKIINKIIAGLISASSMCLSLAQTKYIEMNQLKLAQSSEEKLSEEPVELKRNK